MTFCQLVSYTQPKISKDLRYLLNIYCGINTWTGLFLLLFYCYILEAVSPKLDYSATQDGTPRRRNNEDGSVVPTTKPTTTMMTTLHTAIKDSEFDLHLK